MTRYLTKASYDDFTPLIRKVNAGLGYPNRNTRTQRYAERWVNSGTSESLLIIEEDHWSDIQNYLTAAEISATTESMPSGFTHYPMSSTPSVNNREVNYWATRVVICDGDSIISTANSPWNLAEADRVYTRVDNELGNLTTDHVINVGVGGKTVNALKDDAAAKIHDMNFPDEAQIVVVLFAGTNDIHVSGRTVEQTYGDIQTYVTDVKAAISGVEVIVCTPIARLSTTSPTDDLRDLRDEIMANAATDGFTVADCGGHTAFDAAADTTNATYYQADEEHPTATGAQALAEVIATAIEGL